MIARVFLPGATESGQRLDVGADEAGHLVRVLRLGAGAAVRVFDGRGQEWEATLIEASRQRVVVELGAGRAPARETRVRYTLAMAVLKGDAFDEVVRDAAMLGVDVIRPVLTARTEVSAASLTRGHRRERWTRIAASSVKQCGRAVVPQVDDAGPVAALWPVAMYPGATRLLLVEPAAGVDAVPVSMVAAPARVVLAVGPEGGWTTGEVAEAVAAGWRAVTLGDRVLRAERAPLVALAACQAVWADR